MSEGRKVAAFDGTVASEWFTCPTRTGPTVSVIRRGHYVSG